ISSTAVPQGRDSAMASTPGQDRRGGLDDAGRVAADEDVCPHRTGDRAFGVIAQCETRHTEDRSFLLDAAAVGQDHACVSNESDKRQITKRFNEPDVTRWWNGS